MKFRVVLVLACAIVMSVAEEHEGGGDEGHHEQQQPPQSNEEQGGHDDQQNQQKGADGQKGGKGEEGYQQGFNQGIKPYSYGYNTGIKPYTYNYYQPLGGKPQVSESGGDKMADGKPMKAGQSGQGKSGPRPVNNAPPPQMPPIPINIDFPDFSAFGLPPPGPPQGQQSGAYRAQPQQQQFVPNQGGTTAPPFNYAEYGIPTDVGSATGQGNSNSPFNFGGQQNRPQMQQQVFPFGGGAGNGDDFGIFGNNNNNVNYNNNNNGNGNLPLIPVLEDGTNNNGNNANNNANGGFGIPGIVGPNDFSVAASDFEPLNILDTLVPLNGPLPARGGQLATGVRNTSPRAMGDKQRTSTAVSVLPPLTPSTGTRMNKTTSSSNTVVTTTNESSAVNKTPSSAALMAQRRHYKLAVSPSNVPGDSEEMARSKRSISERPGEVITKLDPNSAYSILNMDPQYTNPNQGVYSYYPAYNNPL